MPTELGESVSDDLTAPPTAGLLPQPLEEVTSPQMQPEEEEAPACGPEPNQSEATGQEQEDGTGPSQAGHQSNVIKNVDEIFHTIEGLMSKLRHLKVGSYTSL